ncbi:MAG: heat-inducible transcriptional repressor HrcA [Firmicutes bacterium]|nr:heat-inducible transcriptional repressor HrcA [Bacillota bacterium]
MEKVMEERKRAILRAVADDYISTAEPVGSRTIARRYGLGISPATIRNEMADLEEEGYLEQPHASAGRVPSDKGYRFYVDALMSERGLSGFEEKRIRAEYEKRRDEIQSLIKATAKVLGDLSKCASVVVAPAAREAEIRHIQLVPVNSDSVLVLVVTTAGLVEHKLISIEHALTASDLDRISGILNKRLRGASLSQMRGRLLREVQADLTAYASFIESTVELLLSAVSVSDQERVYTDGLTELLTQPEFREIERAKPVLGFLGSDDLVLGLFSGIAKGGPSGPSVRIGSENARDELKGCSVVSASYGIGGRSLGTIGVIGPTRMDYAGAMALVSFMAEGLSDLLTRMSMRKARV